MVALLHRRQKALYKLRRALILEHPLTSAGLRALFRGGDLYTFGAVCATATSKSATRMHASATPTWKRTICWTKMIHCHFAREIFRHNKAFHRPERDLCWSGRPFVGRREFLLGLKWSSWSKRALHWPNGHCAGLKNSCTGLRRYL